MISSQALSRLRRAIPWTLVDQCIVSLGNFAVTLLLARLLTPADYGVYSLLFLAMLGLQTVTSSLVFYPLSVNGTVLAADERAALFGNGLLLLGALSVPLIFLLAAMLWMVSELALVVPAVAWLVFWQVQELMRRVLLTEMRHAAATPGDAMSYLGQAVGIVILARAGGLTLASALVVMAVTSALAALVQATQASVHPNAGGLLVATRQCWTTGRFSLVSNLLSSLRTQVFPWVLTALGGTALAAHFQAAQNLVMAANPILLGLCNVIPQAAARGLREAGTAQAWHAARRYILLGAAPICAFYILLLLWPGPMLLLLYGAASPYLDLTLIVRAMSAAALIGYVAEMVCSYFHGLRAAGLAMKVNMAGLVTSILFGLPLMLAGGLAGSCIALIATNLVRSIVAVQILTKTAAGTMPSGLFVQASLRTPSRG
jgi:O-antigen/teichoic acid export membrane protein